MWLYFVISLVFFLVIILIMGIGYWIQRKTISGSCGGLSSIGIEKECKCDTPCEKRLERERKARNEKLTENQIL